jgi:hypothetical protein
MVFSKGETIMDMANGSVITKKQVREYRKTFDENERRYLFKSLVRYDDSCRNGHNTFSITGIMYDITSSIKEIAGGCLHEEISKHFPELQPLLKWHLCSSDGPLHYIGNTIYHASNRDHWGLLAGEFRQHTSRGKYQNNGVEGVPKWELAKPNVTEVYATECPKSITLQWKPSGITGTGKERDLQAARSSAIWPEATDEQLCQPKEQLEEMLKARLPKLMQEFRTMVESLGFVY